MKNNIENNYNISKKPIMKKHQQELENIKRQNREFTKEKMFQ